MRERFSQNPEPEKIKSSVEGLVASIENSDIVTFSSLINKIDNINDRNAAGTTPLIAAIKAHKPAMFALLINHRSIDVNATDSEGKTPL